MKRMLSAAFVLALSSPCVLGQTQPPVGRTEILGRLALDYSPSYIAHLVRTRGLASSPPPGFIDQVRQAGGAGILADNLPNAAVADSNALAQQAEAPVEQLAACAKLMHAHDYYGAESECRAAIRENPASEWPYRDVAWLLQCQIPPVRDADPESKPRRDEQNALLQQAAALTPAAALDPNFPRPPQGFDGVVITEAQEVSYAAGLMAFAEQNISGDTTGQLFPLVFRLPPAEIKAQDPDPPSEVEAEIPAGLAAAIQIEPDLASNHLYLAQYYEGQMHEPDQAEREFREAIRLEPDAERPHAHLAVFYDRRRDYEGSVAELREVVRIASSGEIEHAALARELETAGHVSEAFQESKTMTATWPDSIDVSNGLIQMYLRHNNHKGAIEELRRSLRATAATFNDESKFVEARESSEEQLADLLDEARDFDAAADQYLYLLRFNPDDASLHLDLGNVLADQRLCDRAIGEYNEALRLQPDWGIPLGNIGNCLVAKNDLDGAIAKYREAETVAPSYTYAQVALGAALAQKGDSKAAREQFRQILEANPDDADAHSNFGYALFLLKETAGAIQELKRALELQPDADQAQNSLAWIYCTADDLKFRNPAESLALARKAVASSDIPNPSYLDTLAEALLQNGQAAEALATETKAFEADPGDARLPPRLDYFRKALQKSAPADAGTASMSEPQK